MYDGLRFIDCDMHVIEWPGFLDKYLDPAFKSRAMTGAVGADGTPRGGGGYIIDGIPQTGAMELQKYRKPTSPNPESASSIGGVPGRQEGSDRRSSGPSDFAARRGFDAESQEMAIDMAGIDMAVLFPTTGNFMNARENMDPELALALCQAYNNWIHDFCQQSPDRMKFVAVLPMEHVGMACRELVRCVKDLGAVASVVRPNLLGNGHYWHSNYWNPLYSLHEELDVAWCFHEGVGAWISYMNRLYGENEFYRHVACHWIEAQQALIAQIIGGVFEFHPKLRVGYMEAENSWVPGLLSRIERDYAFYRDSRAPYLSLTPLEYFQRNCWAAVGEDEPQIEQTASLIGADRMCISTDYPHFDSSFPNTCKELLEAAPREIAAEILYGAAGLYGFTEEDLRKADAAAAKGNQRTAAVGG